MDGFKPLLVRLSEKTYSGLVKYKNETGLPYSRTCELALRKFLGEVDNGD